MVPGVEWSGLTSFRESLPDADITITKKIVEADKLFDIAVLDHLIIANGYNRLADNGMI